LGYFGGIARKRPSISAKNKAKKLAFAKLHINKPNRFWRKNIWSDESKQQSFSSVNFFKN